MGVLDVPPLSRAQGDARYSPGRTSPLTRLLSMLATRKQGPVRLCFTGSSTTQGINASGPATRYVNLLVGKMQAAFPSGLGSESTVTSSLTADWGTLTTAAGVHGYNCGIGGQSSSNYLSAAMITKIGALNPRAVFHMVGANDIAAGTTPADYKANIQSWIAALKAVTPGPLVNVLVHTYPRMDLSSPTYSWDQYRQALADIVAADPTNVLLIDLAPAYAQVGIPTAYTRPVATGAVIGRDSLRRTDTALNNADTGQLWTPDGTWSLSSSGAVCTAGSGLAYLDVGTGEQDVSVTVNITGSAVGAIGLLLNASDAQNRLVYYINANSGAWSFGKFDGSASITTLANGSGLSTAAGTTNVLRATSSGNTITLYVNGTQVGTYTLTSAEQTKYKAFTKVGLRFNPAVNGTLTDLVDAALAPTTTSVVDPLNLVGIDNLHQGDAGHAFMAAQLGRELELFAAPTP